ncbi:MAG: restriction endonuclease subunit S [Nitrincola lacisaponensis]|uniref:restriction endonuclease subunit S n=1 Tax=Nitrincola lacisaponensis TaxID=267850 RepID=UPI00391DF5B9
MSAQELITEHLDLWMEAVTKKSTSGRGSNGKIELTGVKKLRELILELAVKGRLVNQNPNAEPADVLLARLRDERLELEKSKKIKKRLKTSESTNVDELTALPSNWCWSQLGEVAFKLTDGSHNPPKDSGRGIPMLSSQNVNFGRIDFECPSRYLTLEDFVKEDARTKARSGDVLLTIVASLGRAAVVPPEAPQFALQRSVAVIGTPIDSDFLAYQLIAPKCLHYYDTHGKGTAQKGIYLGKLAVMPIAVPPLEEQQRIVQKVDELMALCDQLEQQTCDQLAAHETLVDTLLSTLTQSENATELAENWTRLATHFDTLFTTEQSIDKLKQSILQLAVMGRLVEQDAGDEPADMLVSEILHSRDRLARTERMKTKADDSVSPSDQYIDTPSSWAWIRLGNMAKFIDYRGKTPTKISSGKRLITAKNIRRGFIDLEPEEFISEADYASWMTRGFPRRGDLLFTPEAPLGNAAIVDLNEEFALAQRAICFQWHTPEVSKFMLLQVLAHAFQQQLIENATGMTATGIKAAKLKEIPVTIPPRQEQHRIVQKVDELMALCDQLKGRLNQASETRCQLAEALVSQAVN